MSGFNKSKGGKMNHEERAKLIVATLINMGAVLPDPQRAQQYIVTELYDATATEDCCECGYRTVVCGECGAQR